MSIKQMQVSYNSDQDRIFLVIDTNQQESLKFALTRRICRDLLASVSELFAPNEFIDSDFLASKQQNRIIDDDANQELKIKYPLGRQSVLVTHYQVISHNEKLIKIILSCLDDKKVELCIDINAFGDVLILLGKVLADANWGLDSLISEHGFSYARPETVRFLN